MNILTAIRERIKAVIAAVFAAIFFCLCGVIMTFVMAPGQGLKARRIANLPQMDAQSVQNAAIGDDVLVSGILRSDTVGWVAFVTDEWQVSEPAESSEDSEPSGSWRNSQTAVSDMVIEVNQQDIDILASSSASIRGPLPEELIFPSDETGLLQAEYDGEFIPEGTVRVRGFEGGDLMTVLGTKASTGGIVPDELYFGDRVAFEESEANAARGLLIAGICFMVLAPLIFFGGIFGAVFGRMRQG
jgi:hypothetical protein